MSEGLEKKRRFEPNEDFYIFTNNGELYGDDVTQETQVLRDMTVEDLKKEKKMSDAQKLNNLLNKQS